MSVYAENTQALQQEVMSKVREIKPLDSQQRTKQVEALVSDMKAMLDYLNSTKGVLKGDEKEREIFDKLGTSARALNNFKLEAAILELKAGVSKDPVFATSVVEGMEHPYMKEIKDFFKESGYIFIITQTGKQEMSIVTGESKRAFNAEYLFGKFNSKESKKSGISDGYGKTIEVNVDFLDGIKTNMKGHFGGYADLYSGSVVVIRNNDYEVFAKSLEDRLSRMGEEKRKLVENFEKASNEEIAAYANGKNPSNPAAVMSEIVLLKVANEYLNRQGETPEQKLARVKADFEGTIQFHEVHHQISYRTRSSLDGVIKGLVRNSGPGEVFEGREGEMTSDLFAFIKNPEMAFLGNMDRHQRLISHDPEALKEVNLDHVEASRQLIDDIVKYVEEHRNEFPNVKKSGILVLGELSEKQLSDIGKKLLEKKYEEKGYVFNPSLIF